MDEIGNVKGTIIPANHPFFATQKVKEKGIINTPKISDNTAKFIKHL
jgi:hypothetical protein